MVVPWFQGSLGLSCQCTLEWLWSPSLDLQSWRQVGHWKAVVVAGAEAALWWWSQAASCSAHHSFSSDALVMYVSACQRGRPGLLCWVQTAWCHTMSGCFSACSCNIFVASLVFFVLVLVHQRTSAMVCAHHPSRWCAQPSRAGLLAASLWWRLNWLGPRLWGWWFYHAIRQPG